MSAVIGGEEDMFHLYYFNHQEDAFPLRKEVEESAKKSGISCDAPAVSPTNYQKYTHLLFHPNRDLRESILKGELPFKVRNKCVIILVSSIGVKNIYDTFYYTDNKIKKKYFVIGIPKEYKRTRPFLKENEWRDIWEWSKKLQVSPDER